MPAGAAASPSTVLVNNAGVLEQGAFTAQGAPCHRRVVDLNVSGLTAMLAAFVPAMVRRGHGRVLNVASVSAFAPVPGLLNRTATVAGRATPKWLLRRIAGVVGRRMI